MVGQGALDRLRPLRARRAGCALALGVLVALAPEFDLVLCPWAALFGLPCPGCGLTRAARLLLRGDLPGALALHPLCPLLVPVVVAALISAVWEPWSGPRGSGAPGPLRRWIRRWQGRWSERWQGPAAWALLLLVLGVWLARFCGAFGGPVPI